MTKHCMDSYTHQQLGIAGCEDGSNETNLK